jgi:hypothetical protein
MTREALEIILRLWSDETEFDHKGKYWHITKAPDMIGPVAAVHSAIPAATSAHRRGRTVEGIGHAQARRRVWLYPDKSEPQPGLRRQSLGLGGGGRLPVRPFR